eukprot:GCRY01003563.1.p1 GENE.GCRY01003563.1~~GCRY01003563.1.p1  ORF type:complete len:344 (+),score=65.22 GCRY01003563.1:140-1171(+)
MAFSRSPVWQDREIRFDLPLVDLELRKGEFIIDSMDNVEDTKGNNGEVGSLFCTNLRFMWKMRQRPRTNLSIGYLNVINITMRAAQSKIRGYTYALYVLTKYGNSRFEFIFTHTVPHSPRLFTTVQAVHRAYDTTKLYRELRLRGAIIKDGKLDLLPQEEVYDVINGVWNLSAEQGNLGTFYTTNIRTVWHANLAANFNVSVPYFQIKSVKIRDSKFGFALVIETMQSAGGYILGFRMDPKEKLQEMVKAIKNLYAIYAENPIFGVEFEVEEKPQSAAAITVHRPEDNIATDEEEELPPDMFSVYYAENANKEDSEPVYSELLGLAIEPLPGNITIESLWSLT